MKKNIAAAALLPLLLAGSVTGLGLTAGDR